MAKTVVESSKRPKVDLVGQFIVSEPIEKTNAKNGQTYTVAPGEYPVMALLSDDRNLVQNVGVMFQGEPVNTHRVVGFDSTEQRWDSSAMTQAAAAAEARELVQNGTLREAYVEPSGLDRATIVDPLRPLDVPALAQSGQIQMEANADRSVRFPLEMFLGKSAAVQEPSKDRSQERAQEHALRISA